jgi:hypothetical protein
MEGLHDMCPIRSRCDVIKRTDKFLFAEIYAASIPAWPPPTTTISNFINFHLELIFENSFSKVKIMVILFFSI